MTLGEWDTLEKADGETKRLDRKDLHFLRPLAPAEAVKMKKRARWSTALPLPTPWLRSPFLLELVLEVAEKNADLRDDLPALLAAAIAEADEPHHYYVEAIFKSGLSAPQREALRLAARDQPVSGETCQLLAWSGLLVRETDHFRLADPVLADHLPPPFIVHHVSDIHVGDKSAETADVKLKGALGSRLGAGVGAGPVRDAYLDHVRSLRSQGRSPHLVVISGDLAERGDTTLYGQLTEWFAALQSALADHPHLPDDCPRFLLVGGNHDVDWN
jgi:hypothetical protein